MKQSYVYIVTNKNNTVLYTGITSNLIQRIYKHKDRTYDNSFTKRYNVDKLVYFEVFGDIELAILREKEIKGFLRSKKEELINKTNPNWHDMYGEIVK
ncbi:MAG: GIY-YIG nuclease family protein [Alphaproteobacteria bacterium]|jgi:putative endonuclease|nr:GIY-YIG nuclease family protein [Alphaproteobacteria bacterium]